MGETMAQSEIDALLNADKSVETKEAEQTNPELSPEEIETLFNADKSVEAKADKQTIHELSPEEIDALGEIGNISMGTAATTLSKVLNKDVIIDTPNVLVVDKNELRKDYPSPYVAVVIEYTRGLQGENLLNIKNDDVKLMTDLMLGGEGKIEEGPITEMHLSAIGEAMNQMMGTSATALAQIFDTVIDISPPNPFIIDYSESESVEVLKKESESKVVKIIFKLIIGDLLESEIMQIMHLSFAKEIVRKLFESYKESSKQEGMKKVESKVDSKVEAKTEIREEEYSFNKMNSHQDIKKVKYQDFKQTQTFTTIDGSPIDLLLDVPLQVTVELGKTRKPIKEILNFNIGTIIELNKVAGDPVDIVIGGKTVGRGEVVVIDETFGVRVTEVIASGESKKQER